MSRVKKSTVFSRADTFFIHHDSRYSASHPCRNANTCIQTGTKITSPSTASTNTRAVSKAARVVTCGQQNIACALCAHIVAVKKRGESRADLGASPVGHGRGRLRIRSSAVGMGVERTRKLAAALDQWYAA